MYTYILVRKNQRGFTLLLATLVASTVLAIGSAIYTLAAKEVRLSSLGRDSQFAFYAADTGAECALFWDVRYSYFATTSPATVIPPDPRCDTQEINATGRTGFYPQTMIFRFEPGGRCVDVTVAKTQDSTTQAIKTIIHADGYNNPCTGLNDPNTLQRSVEIHY